MLDDIDRTADRIGIMVDGVLRVDCPLDTFRNQVRKVVVEFDREPPEWNGCLGLVQQGQVGKRRDLVFVGYGDLQRRAIEALAPKRIDLVDLSLEDAFIEYTRTNRNPLPLWEENHE
jgi:ABC-2 type transport system ATP-binding protein